MSEITPDNFEPLAIPPGATRDIIRMEAERRLSIYYGSCPRAFAAAYAQCALGMCDAARLHEIADAVMQLESARATNDHESHAGALDMIGKLFMIADVPLPEINSEKLPCFVAAASLPTIRNFPRVEVEP